MKAEFLGKLRRVRPVNATSEVERAPEVWRVSKIGRPGMSDAQKREVWQRWKQGQSLSEIGRALGKVPGSIHGVVKANGGSLPLIGHVGPAR